MSAVKKSFDIVKMSVDMATAEFAPDFVVNPEALDILNQYCSVVDELAQSVDAEAVDATVDRVLMTIGISIVSGDLVVYKKDYRFLELMKRALNITFVADGDRMCSTFVFPSVWMSAK